MPSQHVEAATKVTPFAATLALIRSDVYVYIHTYMCVFVCVYVLYKKHSFFDLGLGKFAADMLALIDYKIFSS